MITELGQIQNLRKRLGLNQKELAERAGVSQSLIAKIEASQLDPSFTNAKKIFSALEELREKKEVKAKEIMSKNILFAHPQDKVKTLIQTIKRKGISQVPVINQGRVCGLITESAILKKIMEHPEKINELHAEEVMEEAPPIVSQNTGLKTLLEIVKDYPVILVAEKGEIKGIISKIDLLGKVE